MLKISKLSIGLAEIPQRGSPCLDRFGQDVANDGYQMFDALPANLSRFAFRVDFCAKKSLADVDIAQSGDNPLVQKHGFHRGHLAFEGVNQVGLVERVSQRFRSQPSQQFVALGGRCRHQVHRAEPAWIVEGDAGAVRHVQHDMIMLLRCRVVVHELPERVARNQHASRHAQMDQQRLSAVEIGEDVFRPPPKPLHPSTRKPSCHIGGKRPAQIGAVYLGMVDNNALHRGRQSPFDGFDFGKLRHPSFL